MGIPRIKAMTDIVTAGYDQGSSENPVGVSYGQCILKKYCYDLSKF